MVSTLKEQLEWCHQIRQGPPMAGKWLQTDHSKLEYGEAMNALAFDVLAEHLFREGYVVFPMYSPEESQHYVTQFQETEKHFPEYRKGISRGTQKNPYVLGGFGAYGNPASFHNLFVREQRKNLCAYLPLFGQLLKKAGKHQQLLFPVTTYSVSMQMDRMCKRPQGSSTTSESYHRDLIPTGHRGDFTIGGWIQFSQPSSFFSCVPKTHRFSVETSTKGFAVQKGKQCTTSVEIPAGSILLFLQNMGHCVHPTKQKHDSYRLFVNFLLTPHKTPIFDYRPIIEEQGVPRLPSNQKIPMYGANHASFWLDKITIPWSATNFPKRLLTQKRKKDGTEYWVVDSPMKSLYAYKLPLYPPYELWEKEMFEPFRSIMIDNKKYTLFYP